MGYSDDDMSANSTFYDEDFSEFSDKELEILSYCKPHLEQMWAARIASIILECDFRDCKNHYELYKI